MKGDTSPLVTKDLFVHGYWHMFCWKLGKCWFYLHTEAWTTVDIFIFLTLINNDDRNMQKAYQMKFIERNLDEQVHLA